MNRWLKGVGVLVALAAGLDAAPSLDEAEVRISYGELRKLIEAGRTREPRKPEIPASLAASWLSLSLDGGTPVIDARFRALRFADELSPVPLIGGDVVLERIEPESARIVVREGLFCEVSDREGASEVSVRLRVTGRGRDFTLVLPPCPSVLLETSKLPDGHAVVVGDKQQPYPRGAKIPLQAGGGEVRLRVLEPSSQLLRPPAPSTWSWQHQVLVVPNETELSYEVRAHASAADGSGVEATVRLPADARGVTADGDDLVSSRTVRDGEGNYRLRLKWSSRDVLERDLVIRYRVPLRPLDETWTLHAPGGMVEGSTHSRFLIPSQPDLSLAAPGLTGPVAVDALPSPFRERLAGMPCHFLEGGTGVDLAIRRLPVVATEDAIISEANWVLELEPDGAMLAEGAVTIRNATAQRVTFDTPEGMKLLACRVGARAVDPIDSGEGRLEIPLPAGTGKEHETVLNLSFTGKTEALDPLEGVMRLTLPRTPVFIRSLSWGIRLPSGYRAEVEGNLSREATAGAIHLRKQLCRDERPEVRVFYQSQNLTP